MFDQPKYPQPIFPSLSGGLTNARHIFVQSLRVFSRLGPTGYTLEQVSTVQAPEGQPATPSKKLSFLCMCNMIS
jgi:hypothetical protein